MGVNNILADILSERDSLEDKDEILSPHVGKGYVTNSGEPIRRASVVANRHPGVAFGEGRKFKFREELDVAIPTMCVATFPLLLGGAGGKVVTHTPASKLPTY